jgi:hypothetical protein
MDSLEVVRSFVREFLDSASITESKSESDIYLKNMLGAGTDKPLFDAAFSGLRASKLSHEDIYKIANAHTGANVKYNSKALALKHIQDSFKDQVLETVRMKELTRQVVMHRRA